MKLSRLLSSLESVERANVIFDADVKVPSEFTSNEPFAPVAVSTASDGRLTPTSCSRTLIVALDLSLTVQAPADAVVAPAVAVGVVVAVDVGLGVESVADPSHAATRMPAPIAAAIERACVPMVTIRASCWSGDCRGS